jgi:cytidine deaminase
MNNDDQLIKAVIAADSEQAIVPIGACRQVLAEFSQWMKILASTKLPQPTQGISVTHV